MGRDTRRCEATTGLGTPYAAGLPYGNPMAPQLEEPPGKSATEIGVATFGPQYVETLVVEVTTRALKAAWYQKWQVQRRLRPEEFGGRVHNHVTHQVDATKGKSYPFNLGEFNKLADTASPPDPASVLGRIFEHNRLQNANRRQSVGVP